VIFEVGVLINRASPAEVKTGIEASESEFAKRIDVIAEERAKKSVRRLE
jgi:hypothetical protein